MAGIYKRPERAHLRKANPLKTAFLAKLDQRIANDKAAGSQSIGLKAFLTSEDFCAPYLRASAGGGELLSPVAEALVDAIEGRPITTLTAEQHRRIFGCELGTLTPKRARTYVCSTGGRAGKTSRFLTCVALWCAWTVALPTLSPGEVAFAFISAPKRALAKRCLSFVLGCIQSSPVLRAALLKGGVEAVKIRRPDGHVVSIEVSTKGKLSGRAGTCVYYGVDEAEFFLDSAAQDLDEQIKGAEQRVVPGGMIGIVSTPFIEGEGEMQRVIQRERGKHIGALICERVSTRELNPSWDPTGEIEASMRRKPGGDANVDRDVYAIPYPRGTKRFFNAAKLYEAAKRLSLKTNPPLAVGAGSDLGFRRDGSALVIAKRYADHLIGIPVYKVERPTDGPLVPRDVCTSFAATAREHGASGVAADRHGAETYRQYLNDAGLAFLDAPTDREGKWGLYQAAFQVFADNRICLGDLVASDPNGQELVDDLVDQLSRITTKKLPGGGEEIIVPHRVVRTEADAGSVTTDHCDGAAAFVIALWAAGAGAGIVRTGNQQPISLPVAITEARAREAPTVAGVSFGMRQDRYGRR